MQFGVSSFSVKLKVHLKNHNQNVVTMRWNKNTIKDKPKLFILINGAAHPCDVTDWRSKNVFLLFRI